MSAGLRVEAAIAVAAGAGFALSGQAEAYPAFAVVLLELVVAAWLFPEARFQFDAPLAPKNWAILLFHIHLVAAPLLGICAGFERGSLRWLPSPEFINRAMLLGALAHLCFAAGAQLGAYRTARSTSVRFSSGVHRVLGAAFVLIGFCGLGLIFKSLGGYLRYVTVPETHTLMFEATPTLADAAGTFLRHFFTFGLFLLWSNRIAHKPSGHRHLISTVGLVAMLVLATASYNRASMVGPVLATLAAYSVSVKKLSTRAVLFAGAGIFLVSLAFGAYRDQNLSGVRLPAAAKRTQVEKMSEFLQIYGEGPQFLGYLLERTQEEPLHLGRSIFASAMSPVPLLGKDFREASGVNLYNRLIYGRRGVIDQIIPASGELVLNFHLPGVIAFFAALGWTVQRIEQRFHQSASAFNAAAVFFLGMWVAVPISGSVAVLSQLLLYAFWPVYSYFGLRRVLVACRLPERALYA